MNLEILTPIIGFSPFLIIALIIFLIYRKSAKKIPIFHEKNIILLIFTILIIGFTIILSSIKNEQLKKEEAERMKIENERQLEREKIERERMLERQKIENERNIILNEIKLETLNLASENLSIQDLLKILIKYNENDLNDRLKERLVLLGIWWDIDPELSRRRIHLKDFVTDKLLDKNLSFEPNEIVFWVSGIYLQLKTKLMEIPVDQRRNTYIRFKKGEVYEFEYYFYKK